MSGYILCQVRRARVPYYIENISANIYSIEELCFYLYHNIYLLDSSIINEELCFWIRDELGLKKLSQKLYGLLDDQVKIGDFILPIFKEINYLSLDEFRRLNQQIQKLAQEPAVLRQKLKGDYLMEHGNLGGQFAGGIYHNMGCAYAKLFQMDEAIHCFSLAYEHLRTMASIKSYLYAVYMEYGEEALEDKARQLGVDDERRDDILLEVEIAADELFETADGKEYARALEEKKKGNFDVYREAMKSLLTRLTGEYHKSTGY